MMLALTALHVATLLIAAILLLLAAVNDANKYRIPNTICIALVLFFPLYVWTSPHPVEWQQSLLVSLLLLLAGLAMFFANFAGAGDVKLLAAMGLWAGPHFVAIFLIVTTLAGGILALVMAALTFYRNHRRSTQIPISQAPIPYGIAIAFGGWIVVYHLSAPILAMS